MWSTLLCVKCPTTGLYVGKTGHTLHQRMSSHRSNINCGKTDFPVVAHFCSNNHSIDDLQVIVLMSNFKTQQEQKEWEYKFMQKFNTI
ncbi:hypothetical protein XELAEV_18045238mg [Xenopus laevis]|uniref:GIY-YIG domain-containing protein n=1 Tax=Xenopus laevis TaxID=8355 RepID=A0A974C0M2_XENLA|nr:hypothetical protein XELAEV_18045238mg [Xenopus laevis]